MADVHLRPDWLHFVEAKAMPGVKDTAQRIADSARRRGVSVGDVDGGPHEYPLPVRVFDHDDSSSVILAHPSGKAVQAKHGTLTRAAASQGYEVRG